VTPFPYVGAALEVGDYLTHWPLFRWLGYACSFAGLLLGLRWQWRARRAPVAVTYSCPSYCGFLGDLAACEAHAEHCQAGRGAA
jgi:hypothetical protein